MEIYFKVTQIIDPRKYNSDIEIGPMFRGTLSKDRRIVTYTDKANCTWSFWVGETCLIFECDLCEDRKKVNKYSGTDGSLIAEPKELKKGVEYTVEGKTSCPRCCTENNHVVFTSR